MDIYVNIYLREIQGIGNSYSTRCDAFYRSIEQGKSGQKVTFLGKFSIISEKKPLH